MGISRVFQTPEIFGDLNRDRERPDSLLRQARRGVPDACLQRASLNERDLIEKAEQRSRTSAMIEQARHACRLDVTRATSGGSRWRCASFRSRSFCCSTSPPPGWRARDTNNTIDLLKEISDCPKTHHGIIEHDITFVFSLAERITVLAPGHAAGRGHPGEDQGPPQGQGAYLGKPRSSKGDTTGR